MAVIDESESQVETRRALAKPAQPATPTIAHILDKAVENGMTPDALNQLVALYERVADRQAAQEFAAALAQFQNDCPPISKTSTAKVVTKGGSSYQYSYAELDEIARTVRPLLHKLGLSYTWDMAEDKGVITCTCIVRHVNGHSERAHFSCPTDTAAAMSGAQKNAAALTYARRQSLVQALGLTTCDPDADMPPDPAINEHEAANLDALIDEVGADRAAFLKWLGVESVAAIPASRFRAAVAALEEKRRQTKNRKGKA